MFVALLGAATAFAQSAEINLTQQSLHPRYREWSSPLDGSIAKRNPQPLLWAVGDEDAMYRVELSTSADFAPKKSVVKMQEWAVSVPDMLRKGRYFWRVTAFDKEGRELRQETNSFIVDGTQEQFNTMSGDRFVEYVKSLPHFRLYVHARDAERFRAERATRVEAKAWVRNARKKLDMDFVPVAPTRPRDTTGMTDNEKRTMINFMYHKFGEVVSQPAVDFSIAYLLTGEREFAEAAVRHAVYVASLPVDSDATSEDFNRSAIMYALALTYDTAYEYFSLAQREAILEAIRVRGEYFYRHYVRHFESHSMDNHVWQHTFRNFFFASIATAGDIPQAEKWLRYGYDVWRGRFPILGGNDGGWHDGNSYFEANLVSFVYIPFVLSRLTGDDFFDLEWYRRLPSFLVYSFPKGSNVPTFGDDYDKLTTPPAQYVAFADALARELRSGEARWYADNLIDGDMSRLQKAKTFHLYRILTDVEIDDVTPVEPERLSAKFFPDAGFSLMHSDPTDSSQDVMLAFMSVPFGATGHAHAAHNSFSIAYGGRTLFGGTGYYSNFNDKHTLMHYRSRGHNTILADSLAQVIGENGYGWLPRFSDTEHLTYTLGDASHAYDEVRTPFWLDRMQKFGVEPIRENGFGDPKVKRFRRHFVYLKPDIVVIYDELQAQEPIVWTWLLHSRADMQSVGEGSVVADNGRARCYASLFTDGLLQEEIHSRFFSPAINWKGRKGPDGKTQIYYDNRHAEFTTREKSLSQRFLAVLRVVPNGAEQVELVHDGEGRLRVGDWTIEAALDGEKPAMLRIMDSRGNGVEYNTSSSSIEHSTLIYDNGESRELVDKLPVSIDVR